MLVLTNGTQKYLGKNKIISNFKRYDHRVHEMPLMSLDFFLPSLKMFQCSQSELVPNLNEFRNCAWWPLGT